MAAGIAVTVLLLFGLMSREHRVSENQSEVALLARARSMAIADSSCQASLRRAPNDSVRASIVDACVQLILVSERAKQQK